MTEPLEAGYEIIIAARDTTIAELEAERDRLQAALGEATTELIRLQDCVDEEDYEIILDTLTRIQKMEKP